MITRIRNLLGYNKFKLALFESPIYECSVFIDRTEAHHILMSNGEMRNLEILTYVYISAYAFKTRSRGHIAIGYQLYHETVRECSL